MSIEMVLDIQEPCEEKWMEISKFPGYFVSDGGNVKGPRGYIGYYNLDGYKKVGLCRDGTVFQRSVHRLVLEAFIGPCPKGMVACHGKGGIGDNSIRNLCWGTPSKNLGADKRRDGTMQRGERNGRAVLSDADIDMIRDMYNRGLYTQCELAKRFNVGQSQISRIVRVEQR